MAENEGHPLLWIGGGLLALLGLGAAAWIGLKPKGASTTNTLSNMTRAAATYMPSAPAKSPGCGCGKK